MATTLITTYSADFRGMFGKKRTAQHIGTNSPYTTAEKAREALTRKAGSFKRGILTITRYDNCEQTDFGSIIIPITQGVIIERTEIDPLKLTRECAAWEADQAQRENARSAQEYYEDSHPQAS